MNKNYKNISFPGELEWIHNRVLQKKKKTQKKQYFFKIFCKTVVFRRISE